jgi:riboflavin kinase/FMN adenylyltransferase
MRITRGLSDYRPGPHPVLAIGNFDGQHRGHLALLQAVVETARAAHGTPVVLTFDPHPAKVLSPGITLLLLTTPEEKLDRFETVGIEEVLFLEFTKAFASLSPEEFIFRVLRDGVGARELFVGEHFAFGKGRAGRIGDLQRLGPEAGFRVHPVSALRVDGEVVSSTRVRRLIQSGDVRTAARCLGRYYALEGRVMSGEGRGKRLGWPTANLHLPEGRVIPADGVYATIVVRRTDARDELLESVSYIGSRPTFGLGERLLEVHVLDERVELYGEPIQVRFVERLRGDQSFESAEALSARIAQDVLQARESLRAVS